MKLGPSRARGAAAAAGVALVLAWVWLALASNGPKGESAESKMGNGRSFGPPVVMGAESIMAKKAHGVSVIVFEARCDSN